MKLQSSIKRLNLTLTPDDHFLIAAAIAHTTFSTRSDIIREALNLLSQLRRASSSGVRVVLRHEAEREQYPVALFPASQLAERDAGSVTEPPTQVRLPYADAIEFEWLKENSPEESQVEIIRQALAVYADIVEKLSADWRLLLCSREGSMLDCPVRGIRREDQSVKASSTTAVRDEPAIEHLQDLGWRGVLPARLLDAVAEAAESQGTIPEALITDVVREYVSQRRPDKTNTLGLEPRSVEHLVAVHEQWLGGSLLVAIDTLLDATDFFSVLMNHLQHHVRIFYVTHDRMSREQLEARLKKLPPIYAVDIHRCLHWIHVPPDYFARNAELVIFDPLTEDKASGYTWLGQKEPCYELLSETALTNALREYTSLVIDAQNQREQATPRENQKPDSENVNKPQTV